MNHNFYFDGRQIKNYLVGFASLFSEIPYKNRRGILESVPIHYGSPSDIISHLEMNVDNEETKNRNRIKDISVPMFSFRMTALERNPEKRRAPLDTITVDLRPLGYSTGYVAMRPSPIRFTMELICWASSDYQAFEISEQIIPYFNSPQQVTIEPLPKCPVSTSEVFLDSIEIDTEPESQKYSAMITMSFNLNGWLLTQPRIWSTNMSFEFQMLDKDYKGVDTPANLDDTDFSVGHEIVDYNTLPPERLPTEEKLNSIDEFIRKSPLINEYGEKLDLYNLLVENSRIRDSKIIDTTPLNIEYKGKERVLGLQMMELLIDDMADIDFLYTNELLIDSLKKHNQRDNLKIYEKILSDDTDTLNTYMTLLDHNVVSVGFNKTDINFSNSDKLNMFGSTRIDIDDKLDRLKSYLAAVENIKLNKDKLIKSKFVNKKLRVYTFSLNKIPFESFPEEFKIINNKSVSDDGSNITYLDSFSEYVGDKIQTTLRVFSSISNITLNLTTDKNSYPNIKKNLDDSIDIPIEINVGVPLAIMVSDSNSPKFKPIGVLLVDEDELPKLSDLDLLLGDETYSLLDIIDIDDLGSLYSGYEFLNDRFLNIDNYIISTLLGKQVDRLSKKENISLLESYNKNKNKDIYEKRYRGSFETMLSDYGSLKNVIDGIVDNIDIISPPDGVSPTDMAIGQVNDVPDLSQAISFDNNGKPIYDVNKDGFINQTDLKILGSVVDNPEEFDYEIKYGIWYKRFDPDKVSEDRVKKIIDSLKVLFYLTEKTNMQGLKDYIILYGKGLVSNGFDILDDERKQKEIKALGYDLQELDDRLIFMRLFVESIKYIMVKERDFIIYYVPDMNEESKRMLYMKKGLDIDKIVMGKFLDQYFMNINGDERLDDMNLFRKVLPKTMGDYINYAYQFDMFMNDIKKTHLFIDSIEAESKWLSENLPELDELMKTKYLDK